jgi:hypothetical protein
MEQRSLYDRLGGMEAVVAVIDDFVGRVPSDSRINGKFARTDVPRQQELLGILGPLRSDIVEVESPTTGTPLPESYQPAPPLARV